MNLSKMNIAERALYDIKSLQEMFSPINIFDDIFEQRRNEFIKKNPDAKWMKFIRLPSSEASGVIREAMKATSESNKLPFAYDCCDLPAHRLYSWRHNKFILKFDQYLLNSFIKELRYEPVKAFNMPSSVLSVNFPAPSFIVEGKIDKYDAIWFMLDYDTNINRFIISVSGLSKNISTFYPVPYTGEPLSRYIINPNETLEDMVYNAIKNGMDTEGAIYEDGKTFSELHGFNKNMMYTSNYIDIQIIYILLYLVSNNSDYKENRIHIKKYGKYIKRDILKDDMREVRIIDVGTKGGKIAKKYSNTDLNCRHWDMVIKNCVPYIIWTPITAEEGYKRNIAYISISYDENYTPRSELNDLIDNDPNLKNEDSYKDDDDDKSDEYESIIRQLKDENALLRKSLSNLQSVQYDHDKELSDVLNKHKLLEKQIEDERKELHALREIIFNSQSTDDNQSVDKKFISFPYKAKKKIVVFGGHNTWRAEIKNKLPNVRFIDKDMPPNFEMIKYADIVWIQPNAIAHSFYYRIKDMVAKHDIPIKYLTHPGTTKCAEQIAKDDMGII